MRTAHDCLDGTHEDGHEVAGHAGRLADFGGCEGAGRGRCVRKKLRRSAILDLLRATFLEEFARHAGDVRGLGWHYCVQERRRDIAIPEFVHARYKCRQRVRARYRRGPTYYAATVQAVRDNGTYDVVYEDGSQDECLEEVYLTPAMHGVSEAQTLAPGLLLSALSRVARYEARQAVSPQNGHSVR